MSKRFLATAVLAVAALLAAPAMHADAQVPPLPSGNSAVVAVFTGNADVSPGLCLPAGGCAGTPNANYELIVPAGANPIPAVCVAAGVFELQPVAGNCALNAHGTVTSSALGLNPSCGLSHGESDDSLGANDVSLTNALTSATVTRGSENGWITSAGGTIPVTGSVDDAAGNPTHPLVAVVQARPIPQAGGIPCVTEAATKFIIAGVAVVA